MKQLLFIAIATLASEFAYTQVAISNPSTNPDASAMLDIKSTTKGMLMPRMTSAQRTAIASPATGLMVYETTSNAVWVYNGTAWTQLGSGGGSSQWTTNGTHIYNGNTGNVGIGITAPTAKLHLVGLMKIDGGQIDIDDNLAKVRLIYNGSPKGYFSLTSSTGDVQIGTNVLYNDDGKLQLETKSSARLTIMPNGNIGIGTISPDTKFHVVGNIKGSGRIDIDGVLETGGGLSAIGGAGLYITGTSLLEGNLTGHGSASFSGNITGSGTASISGNINSNTSMSITDVAGTLQFKSNSTTDLGFLQISGNNVRIGTNSGNDLGKFVIRTNGADRVYVDNAGNVSIGTTAVANGYKVSVAGKVMCEELRVQLRASWPDYVFNNNYKLLPLAELKTFIEKNNHLPNIPKASVIEKEGMEVGDMQKKMMQKIEELTLYILDLQKQIDDLKGTVSKKRNLGHEKN